MITSGDAFIKPADIFAVSGEQLHRCPLCCSHLPPSSFGLDKSQKSGRSKHCKSCKALFNKQYNDRKKLMKVGTVLNSNIEYGFVIRGIPAGQGGKFSNVAKYTCTSCDRVLDLPIKSGVGVNPQIVAQRARNLGWKAHETRPNLTWCPRCIAAKPKNDPDSELKKVTVMPSVAAAMPNTPPLTASTVAHPMPKSDPQPTAPAASKEPRPLTNDERGSVRMMLDQHFDDEVGMYLGEMSDQAIADKLAVPRIRVEQIREAAYGPIKVDEKTVKIQLELQAVRSLIDAARASYANDIKACQGLIDAARSDYEKKLKALNDRIAAVEVGLFKAAA